MEKNYSPPVAYNDCLVWMAGRDLYLIDLSSLVADKITRLGDEIKSTSAIKGNHLYVGSESGDLFQININTGNTNKIKIAREPMWKPVVSNDYLFIVSGKTLYQVDVS